MLSVSFESSETSVLEWQMAALTARRLVLAIKYGVVMCGPYTSGITFWTIFLFYDVTRWKPFVFNVVQPSLSRPRGWFWRTRHFVFPSLELKIWNILNHKNKRYIFPKNLNSTIFETCRRESYLVIKKIHCHFTSIKILSVLPTLVSHQYFITW